MFRPRHFASREENYPKLVRALVPYEKQIVEGSIMQVANIVGSLVWKNLRPEKKKRLRMFIIQNKQTILQHIAEIKENKDAVVVHKTAHMRERFFENLAVAMIPHRKILEAEFCIPIGIVKTVAKHLDGPRIEGSRLSSLQGYLWRKKDALLKRMYELDEKAAKENSKLQTEPKPPEEKKNAQGKDNESASSSQNQQGDEIEMDPKVVSPAQWPPSPSRKRYREEEETESKVEVPDHEECSPAPSPCAKRRRLTIDDLQFARWCLQKIRPIFCA